VLDCWSPLLRSSPAQGPVPSGCKWRWLVTGAVHEKPINEQLTKSSPNPWCYKPQKFGEQLEQMRATASSSPMFHQDDSSGV
jgi:hypothetical protein